MRKVLVLSFLAAAVLSLGCAITDYPVIYDSRGADGNAVLHSFYDKAYIVPSGQVATIWSDGTDELYTQVTQDWKGDQWLYTYTNWDPIYPNVNFLGQTYCDPVRQTDCALVVAWNPDLPTSYPFGDQQAGYNNYDAVFDYISHPECPGWRSLSLLVSYTSRPFGECGSGVWADRQGAAYEFSLLEKVNWRGQDWYRLPINSENSTFTLTSVSGYQEIMPVFGQFNMYLDERLRVAVPVTPNAKYQLSWLDRWTKEHGTSLQMNMVYGSLNTNFTINAAGVDNVLDRF